MTNDKNKMNIVPLSELNLTNRFLFDEVMENPQVQQDTLSIIFDRELPLLLEPGIPDYNQLNRSHIIMITPFDLFGYERYQYTFRAICEEEPDCVLEDEATRIFLNTKGKNDSEVSPELVEFLHYIENTTDEFAEHADSERIRRIHEQVRKVRRSEESGVKYMQAWEEKYYEREEGREEGREELLKSLIQKKLAKGKSVQEIADALEEDMEVITKLIEGMEK